MSVLERCPSYRESNERSKGRQGPTLSVRLIEVSVKRESTVIILLQDESKINNTNCFNKSKDYKAIKAGFIRGHIMAFTTLINENTIH